VQAFLAALDQAVPVQQLQMLGEVGLAQMRRGADLGHGPFAIPQRLEDVQARGLAERLEPLGDEAEERRRQCRGFATADRHIAIW
jgi:hypothetical protein